MTDQKHIALPLNCELSSLLEGYFTATLSTEETAYLARYAADILQSETPLLSPDLEADLRLVAAMETFPTMITPIPVPESLSARLSKAVHETATAERSNKKRTLLFRRIWIGAASVAILLISAVTVRHISTPLQPSLNRNTPVLTMSAPDQTNHTADSREHSVINKITTPAPHRNIASVLRQPAENTSKKYSVEKPESLSQTDEITVDEPDRIYLPATATLPADTDDSFLLASRVIDRSTHTLDDICNSSEQSVAKVALAIEEIFSDLNLSSSSEEPPISLSI